MIRDHMIEYNEMMENPADFYHNYSDYTLEDYVELQESFHLLQPLEEKWGKWVAFKCNCPIFFAGACCGHSSAMALLYNASFEFPAKYSTKQLPSSSKSKRKPSAWASPSGEKEVELRKPVWAPRQMELDDMLVVKAPSVRSVPFLYIRHIRA